MWFSFDGCDFMTHSTEADALKEAEHAMEIWRDDASEGGWDELSSQVCCGIVTHSVKCEEIPVTDENRHQLRDGCDGLESRKLVPDRKQLAADITPSDLMDKPHVVVMTTGTRTQVVEFSNGRGAHAYAESLVGDEWKVLVACRIRTMESLRHRKAVENNQEIA